MSPDIDRVCKSDFQKENCETDGFILFENESPIEPQTKKSKQPALYVPEGFVPEQFLARSRSRCVDRARYLLHTIHTQSIFNNRKKADGVHLKAEYLRNFMGKENYRKIIVDLEKGGVIEVDRVARDGVSNCYRLAPDFRNRICKRYYPKDNYLIRKLIDRRATDDRELTCVTRRHLRDQLFRVDIEFESARRILAGISMSPEAESANLSCLERLKDKEWYFTHDQYGRVHHNVTCLKRELRSCLRVDDEMLVELDIANSQPLFCGLTYFNWKKNQNSFVKLWSNDSFNDALRLKEEDLEQLITLRQLQSTTNQISQPTLPLRCPGFAIVNNDVLQYLLLCEQGKLYEHLAVVSGADISTSDKRGIFKERVYQELFFAKWRSPQNRVVQAFEREFPYIYEMIKQVNYKDHSRLAKWMQRVEASLVIDRVVERIRQQHPSSFVLTIHDALLVKQDDVGEALNIFKHEFGRFGIRPKFTVK